MSEMQFILVQAVGLIGSLIAIAGMQTDNRRTILLTQLAGCLCWMFHYGMLGAMTAVFTNIISLGRSVVFLNNAKPWAKSRLWLWFFLVLLFVNSALTFDGWISLFPAIGMTLTTVALWSHSTRVTRLLMLINSPFWLTYDIWSRSYTCAVVEVITFFSFILAIWRFDLRHAASSTIEEVPAPTTSEEEKVEPTCLVP